MQLGIWKVICECKPALQARPFKFHPPRIKASAEVEALVQYQGRSQASHDGDAAAWHEASPFHLAALGGSTSAGRCYPVPVSGYEVNVHERNNSRLSGTSTTFGCRPLSALALPFDAGKVQRPKGEEAARVILYSWLLFLAPTTPGACPYAFVSLRQASLTTDVEGRRLSLTSVIDTSWAPLAGPEDSWLGLCLLLGDGRFQSLEAPELCLRFQTRADFETWSSLLHGVCGGPRNAEKSLRAEATSGDSEVHAKAEVSVAMQPRTVPADSDADPSWEAESTW